MLKTLLWIIFSISFLGYGLLIFEISRNLTKLLEEQYISRVLKCLIINYIISMTTIIWLYILTF